MIRHARHQSRFNLGKVSVLAAIIGVLTGITAKLLHDLIGIVTNLVFFQEFHAEIVSPLGSPLGFWIIFVPAAGGLVIGAMAKWGTPLVRGHGIPEAMEAVLKNKSRVSPKVAVLKPISAAISIGSGQPFGAEGPIIQTGGALGSVIGQLFHMTAAERKVLLACGAAGGLAATFGTPIASIIFAVELLLFEFKTRSFVPLVIASTLATEVYITIFGADPIFTVPELSFGSPINLVFYPLLGIVCGIVGWGLTRGLYRIEDWFHHLRISAYLYPAIGGLFVGVMGYVLPRLTYNDLDLFGPGYYVIENILNSEYTLSFLTILLLSKALVWLVCLGSGTSGGTLAPIFMVGAATGAIFGLILKQIVPGVNAAPLAFAMAGMAAVFGSSTRATFASIIFVFEITHNYQAILPAMLTSVVADALVSHWLPTTILTEQLRRSGVLVSHEYESNILNMIPVASVMDTDPVIVEGTMPVRKLAESIQQNEPQMIRHRGIFVVDAERNLVGILTQDDLLKRLPEMDESHTVHEIATCDVVVAYPDEPVADALLHMLDAGVGRLPVVDRQNNKKIIGYLSRGNIIDAHLQRLREETDVESGWLTKRLGR